MRIIGACERERTGAPSTFSLRGLRITSGIALALLPLLFILAFGLALDDALRGEPTLLFDAAGWLFAVSGVLGLAVLLLPGRAMTRTVRLVLLVVQCALMPVAVGLAAAS